MEQRRSRELGKRCLVAVLLAFFFYACGEKEKQPDTEDLAVFVKEDIYEFGFNLNNYHVVRDTIKKGDNFGLIMERNRTHFCVLKIQFKSHNALFISLIKKNMWW